MGNVGTMLPSSLRVVFHPQWSKCRWVLITTSTSSGRIPAAWKLCGKSCLASKMLRCFFRQLVADSGLDHHRMLAGAHHDGVGSQQNLVSLIGRRTFLPQGFRHYAEHGAPIEQIGAVGEDGQFKVAQRGLGDGSGYRPQWLTAGSPNRSENVPGCEVNRWVVASSPSMPWVLRG